MPRCKAKNTRGEPCGAPQHMVGSDGYCPAHTEGGHERLMKAARKGGEATRRKMQGEKLATDDLPPLQDAYAAETWCDVVGRACVTGRIGHNEANTALRAVREWRESHESGHVSDRLDDLMDALAEWRKTGDPGPVLKLVDG